MTKGKLIVFEGVDGSGTTTQASRLFSRLQHNHIATFQTAQPSSRPTGKLIRQILGGNLIESPSYQTMSLLFAADRQDQQDNEILPQINAGVTVVCDRYVHSSVLYQSVSAGDLSSRQWIKELNRHIVAPDLILFLKIDAVSAQQRRETRGGEEEIFDKIEFQRRLIDAYESIGTLYENHPIVTIDSTQTIAEIETQVWQAVMPLFTP